MPSPSTIIRDVILFTPNGRQEGDCLIEDGRIVELGQVTGRAAEEVKGAGRWLWPGVIDAHVHMRTPGHTHKEDWVSGSAAALAGGVTTAFDMPNTTPSTITLEALEHKRALIATQASINYGLFFGATASNVALAKAAPGIVGLKIFMASSTGDLLVDKDEDLEVIFREFEGQISVHAEDEARICAREAQHAQLHEVQAHSMIRDPEAARLGVERACRLANKHGRRLHILHVSTRAELEALAQGQAYAKAHQTGAIISAEVCPHHLYMSTQDYDRLGTFAQMNPPLRDVQERDAMWTALAQGRFDLIATDHAPHLPEEKRRPYRQAPAGVPGVQTMLPLILNGVAQGRLSAEQALELLCHGPARIYQLQDRGRLSVGAWADLVLIDPSLQRPILTDEQRSRCGWTPYEGLMVTGWPVGTWVNGHLRFTREGDGPGQLIAGPPVGMSVAGA